jgi:serine/threonine-protein kinase
VVRRALELNSRDVRSRVRHVDLLRIGGRSAEALTAVRQGLTLDPTAGRLWAHQGLVLLDLGRPQEAIDAATHALELSNGNQMNQRSLALWVRGRGFESLGELQRAEAEYREALRHIPEDLWSQPSLGYLLGRTGRTAAARAILQDLVRQHRRGKPVCYALALVHAGLGEDQAALEWLEQGLATGDASMPFLALETRFAHLRTQARFAALQQPAARWARAGD